MKKNTNEVFLTHLRGNRRDKRKFNKFLLYFVILLVCCFYGLFLLFFSLGSCETSQLPYATKKNGSSEAGSSPNWSRKRFPQQWDRNSQVWGTSAFADTHGLCRFGDLHPELLLRYLWICFVLMWCHMMMWCWGGGGGLAASPRSIMHTRNRQTPSAKLSGGILHSVSMQKDTESLVCCVLSWGWETERGRD